jgi:hypothetical protein
MIHDIINDYTSVRITHSHCLLPFTNMFYNERILCTHLLLLHHRCCYSIHFVFAFLYIGLYCQLAMQCIQKQHS